MKRSMIFAGLLLGAGAGAVHAAPSAGGLSYDYLEVGLISVSAGAVDGDGLRIGGSIGLDETVYLTGAFSDATLDPGNNDLSTLSLGVGLRRALQPSLHLIGELSFEDVDVGAASDDGFALKGGLRKQVTEGLELDVYLKQVELGNNDTRLGLGGIWQMAPRAALALAYESGDADTLGIGVRIGF